jgi:hypothetical protein
VENAMKKWLGLFLLAPFAVSAAPYLVCAPYPSTGPQPSEFVITLGSQEIVVPATPSDPGEPEGVWMKWDLSGLEPGKRTVTVKARNAWGESASSAPFSFTAGGAAVPSQFRIK